MPQFPPILNPPPYPDAHFMTDRGEGPGMVVLIDSAPYPAVKGPGDPDTLAMLHENYAGSDGELTAILTYIYQNTLSDPDDMSFSNAMLQIAIVEMTHLDLLADAIKTLGGNPVYSDGQSFWQASNIDYATSLPAMLQSNIKSETGAIATYEKQASLTKNSSVRDLFMRIAKDEKLHLRFFKETLARISQAHPRRA